jgi:CheY-like chemotaxis protein
MVHRFGGLDLDRAHQLVPAIVLRKDQVRKNLDLSDPYRYGLIFANVHDDFVTALELGLEQADDAIVLKLLANRANQYRAHVTSPREKLRTIGGKEPAIITCISRHCIAEPGNRGHDLDADVFYPENDAVIVSTDRVADQTTRTILIVDDDRSVADTFARMLKLEGFKVATALSAETGLELADTVRPDAIILDMRMPITNGLQFLRLVRSKAHLVDVPVAIVTGDYFLPESVQLELKSRGASIRFKPLWLEDLIALAKTLVSA